MEVEGHECLLALLLGFLISIQYLLLQFFSLITRQNGRQPFESLINCLTVMLFQLVYPSFQI